MSRINKTILHLLLLYTSFVRQIPERNLQEIRENWLPVVKSESAKHKNSAIREIKLPRKFHATRELSHDNILLNCT